MAGDWIPMRIDLYEDPAVLEMASTLEVRPEVVVGYCHKIWSWMSRQMCDKRVTGVTLKSLGTATNLSGFPELMRDVGWLDVEETADGRPVLVVPNFDRWLSNTAKTRVSAAARKKKSRQNSHETVTEMSRSERDKSVTKGKERKEYSNTPYSPPQGTSDAPDDDSLPAGASTSRQLYSDAFERWWSIYPRKVGKQNAQRQFDRAVKRLRSVHGESARSWLMDVTTRFSQSEVARSEFCPHPATWLSQGRYDDDPSQWAGQKMKLDVPF